MLLRNFQIILLLPRENFVIFVTSFAPIIFVKAVVKLLSLLLIIVKFCFFSKSFSIIGPGLKVKLIRDTIKYAVKR